MPQDGRSCSQAGDWLPATYGLTRRRRGLPKDFIRGEKDAPKFKDHLLPLLFAKRLSDVFGDEVRRLTELTC
jgi:hypothetical protein